MPLASRDAERERPLSHDEKVTLAYLGRGMREKKAPAREKNASTHAPSWHAYESEEGRGHKVAD